MPSVFEPVVQFEGLKLLPVNPLSLPKLPVVTVQPVAGVRFHSIGVVLLQPDELAAIPPIVVLIYNWLVPVQTFCGGV